MTKNCVKFVQAVSKCSDSIGIMKKESKFKVFSLYLYHFTLPVEPLISYCLEMLALKVRTLTLSNEFTNITMKIQNYWY